MQLTNFVFVATLLVTASIKAAVTLRRSCIQHEMFLGAHHASMSMAVSVAGQSKYPRHRCSACEAVDAAICGK
jgi:hypothetical protein